jgi:parallel beta-helix repeat protein
MLPLQAVAQTLSVPTQYSTIQTAIDIADNNDVIVVDPGTYYENINFDGKAITVRSTNPDDPNIVAATVIDGSNPADPNYASVVTFSSGENNDSILSGFTITGGTGTWLVISWDLHEPYWNRCGGGVVCYNMSQPTIIKNVFTNNSTGQGGGIYIYGDHVNLNNPSNPPIHIQPLISDNTFTDNFAIKGHGFTAPDDNYPAEDHGDGGAIVGFQGVDAIITDNLIQNNHADYYGGGIHLRQWSNGRIENNEIMNNGSTLGAGIHITYTSAPLIAHNTITSNATTGGGGGGIYIYYYSDPVIEYNLIAQNEDVHSAAIGIYWESEPLVRNNIIVNNIGPTIYFTGGAASIFRSNTISDNFKICFGAGTYCTGGGIICRIGKTITIENNIITSNDGGFGISVDSGSNPTVKYNNVWDNETGNYNDDVIGDQTGINGNISADPQFESVDNYHLKPASPCINAGDPNYLPLPEETDYDGDNRLMGQYIDIGADEVWPVHNVTTNSEYANIQQAVDDANDYDVIVITRGRHTGQGNRDIDFGGKPLTLQSTNPYNPDIVADTIIDSKDSTGGTHRGFYFHSNEDPNSIINGLTITGGYGAYEGGGIKCIFSSPTIQNCIIRNNRAEDHGGGIYCGHGSNPIIKNCLITENSFSPYGYGAGIYCYKSSNPIILNCVITKNVVLGNSPPGHGRHGGGICCWGESAETPSNPIVANCIISGNVAEHRGGGLYSYWSSPTYINCTVTGNVAYEGGGVGCFREANPKIYNCIVRDNIAEYGNQLALINTLRLWPGEYITEMTVSYSNIQGGISDVCVDENMILHWGDGNIDIDPNFVDPGHWNDPGTLTDPNDDFFTVGNYHLLPISGCRDIGDNSLIPTVSTIDMDDEQRIFNSTVDLGADEVVTSIADFNTDGIVNRLDLVVLANQWLTAGTQLQSDLSPDNFIDIADFALFAQQWAWQGGWFQQQ